MSFSDVEIIGICNNYTAETVIGGGAVKGKNCTIQSISPILGGNRVTFKWTLDDGTVQTQTMDVMNGIDGGDIDFNLFPDAVDVKVIGAVGDGQTDDSAAFTEAIETAITNNVAVIIPDGSYNLNHTQIVLTAPVTFVGKNNRFSKIIDACITAPYGITCIGLTFDGGTSRKYSASFDTGYPSYMKAKKAAIWATPEHDNASVVYDRCVFRNMDIASEAFWSGSDSRKPLADLKVTNCLFEDIKNCAIWHNLDIDNAEISGNVFRNIGSSDAVTDAKIWGIALGDVSNLTAREAKKVIVSENYFDTLLTGEDTSGASHVLNANFAAIVSDQALICNNIFKDLTGYGSDREAIYTKGNTVEISGNLIINGGSGEGYICCKANDYNTHEYRAMNIHGNMLIGKMGRGIRCYGTGHIHDNSICIDNAQMAIRGVATSLDGSTGSFYVENNHIHVGIAPLVVGETDITGYTPDDYAVISCGNKYLYGVRINGNSITVVKDDDTYNHKFTALIKIDSVASPTQINGNVSSASVSDAAIRINDTSAATQTTKTIDIDIEDNVFSEQVNAGFYFNVSKNAYYTKRFKIKNNIVKTRAASNYVGITVQSVSASNNDEVIYESTQAVDAFGSKKHLRVTNAKALYTSLSADYYQLDSGSTSVYQTDPSKYIPVASLKTVTAASSDFADFKSRIAAL